MRTMEKFVRRSLTKKVMPDRSKITVTSENELKYWIKHFGVTREELERAVERSAFLAKPYTVEELLTTLSVHFKINPQAPRKS